MSRVIVFCLLVTAYPGSAVALQGDTFSPYVSTTYLHDSNLLRIDDEVDLASLMGKDERSDTVKTVATGIDVDWEYSRQRFLISVEMNENTFSRFDTLNYQGRDVNARWNWQLGNHLSGVLGQTYSRSLASFADVRGVTGNLRDQQRTFIEVDWLFHPRWQIGLAYSEYSLEYSELIQQNGDTESDTIKVNLYYLTPKGSRVGMELSKKNGRYPNRIFNNTSTVDNGYDQGSVLGIFDWRYSSKSRIRMQSGYVERTHDHLPQRDYDAINSRINYTWVPSVKTQLDVSLFKQTEPRDDLLASVSENEGMSLSANWAPTAKLTLSGMYRTEKQKDLDDPGFLLITRPQSREQNDSYRLSLSYKPHQRVDLMASYSDESRDSSQAQSDFDAQMISISAMIKM
ncbi:XrtB/PEP-CTERM-associated polysaccharide biosynthesis outer membrane protein EpsL [Cycloclasticus pugetii]|uniref:XrtB/PEP-CTERM-associated polysaccharide biosynthesis outer membrane protein EpsL n=1 Tax=Cycloclasticus pugetii TaxID=34068 RepID=UPI00036D427E|nr:XrtB/PEP-CTERM-associated polysaccharide biosynthesis outer membrane protein EpsL [Cycloclasticus pugetii]